MLTILLSKVIGISLVLVGVSLLLRREYYVSVVNEFVEQRLTRLVVVLAELVAGLFLVSTHNNWSSLPAILVTLFGWVMLVEATAYLLLPERVLRRYAAVFSNPGWILGGGAVSVALGAYLTGYGFAMF